MKRLISISLMFLMLGYAFIQVGVFIEYIVDIDAYTQKYCVNIDVPEKKCNGKCQLTKNLAENEEQHQQNELQAPPQIVLFDFIEKIEIPQTIDFSQEDKNLCTYLGIFTDENPDSIFQPPKISVV